MSAIQTAHVNLLESPSVTALALGTEDAAYPLYRAWDRLNGLKFALDAAEPLRIAIDQGASGTQAIDTLIIPPGHNLHQLQGEHFHPTSDTVVTGGATTGAIANVATADESYYTLVEVTGSPGFNWEFHFTALTDRPETLHVAALYTGNPAHNVYVEVYNITTLAWDRYTAETTDFPSGEIVNLDLALPGDVADYYDGSVGDWSLDVRIRHVSNGETGHTMGVDLMCLGDSAELVVSHSADDVTYVIAGVYTPTTGEIVACEFSEVTARYWRVEVTSPALAPQMGEVCLTKRYVWPRQPTRPYGPQERVPNWINEQTASGGDRWIAMGDAKRRRPYRLELISEAHRDAIEALWESYMQGRPFWIVDHEGTYIYGKLSGAPEITEMAQGSYQLDFDFLEVLS